MKIVKVSLLILLCLTLATVVAQKRRAIISLVPPSSQSSGLLSDPQTGNTVLCKGSPVPEGFAISGEMFSDACSGAAWIVKRKPGPAPNYDQLGNHLEPTTATSLTEPNEAIAPGQCGIFQQTIKETYNFKPALVKDAQRDAQSAKLDVFWSHVRQSRATLLPCLRRALKEDSSGSFFGIDGSMLLVEIDPSGASKALQVRKFVDADLDGTDLEFWVRTMAGRGVEGFDTSAAGAKWLSYPKAKYTIARHGDFPVDSFLGAVFIFGSMDEEFATPVLARIASQMGHPHRDDAIAILTSQATAASLRALKEINKTGLSAASRQSLRDFLENPELLKPRAQPRLTREENLRAFQGIIDGDYSAFRELVMKAPDGEVDAIATLHPVDIPLLRRARRASISRCNQHAVSDYASFTAILMALTSKPKLVN
ncbi:MAG: hypothetical protein ABJC10_01125 [Acidobacteriota bacterium]